MKLSTSLTTSLIHRPLGGLVLVLATTVMGPVGSASAGGAGTTLPPFPLPVRQTEFRIAHHIPMVCVNDPGIACVAPYLDAPSGGTNTDGGTFRSTVCAGSPEPGACRPDYISGADITGEFVVDWSITRTPPDPDPGIDTSFTCSGGSYKFCYSGNLTLNVTAPGVAVSNPVAELDYPGECDCFFDVADEQSFSGFLIDDYWVPRNTGATCDIALEYATLLPRDAIRTIGQQAFPALLCQADAMGVCTIEAEPVLVEPDGSLTKGCGEAQTNTFSIRFAEANEPLAFVKKPLANPPLGVGDVNGDDQLDLIPSGLAVVQVNDGNNAFTSVPTGLSGFFEPVGVGDWTGDGLTDLVAESGFQVRVFPGDGTGAFDAAPATVIDPTGSIGVLLRDLNADSRPEAIALGSGTRVIWNQTGGPISPAVEAVGLRADAIADLDGGGTLDLLGAGGGWAENNGPGTFAIQNLVNIPTAPQDVASLIGQEVAEAIGCALPSGSDCCVANGGLGCGDNTCETAVCGIDSFCCDTEWDSTCAEIAADECALCIDPTTPDCCAANGTACSDATCEAIVCALDSSCCGGSWNSDCASTAECWCGLCQTYGVACSVMQNDVASGDIDADGDNDLLYSVSIDQTLTHACQNTDAEMTYLTWLPNLQVDDPPTSGGNPLFDPAVASWRPVGPTSANTDGSDGPIMLVDLDGDEDPDVVGVAFWYRNEGGSFAGPYALQSVAPDLDSSPSAAATTLFTQDMDDDGDLDVVTFDALYEAAPEPDFSMLLIAGIAGIAGLGLLRRSRLRR